MPGCFLLAPSSVKFWRFAIAMARCTPTRCGCEFAKRPTGILRLRPFPREADLEEALAARTGSAVVRVESERYITAMRVAPVASRRLTDTLHRRVGFDVAAETVTLPKP